MTDLMIDMLNDFGPWLAFILTLMVFSYLLGDNPLFRIAQHLLVGLALGFAWIVAWHNVFLPRVIARIGTQDPAEIGYTLVPLVLGALLLLKSRGSGFKISSLPLAYLFGVGAAISLGGAIFGTLIPQVSATVRSLNPADYPAEWAWYDVADALFIVLGTVCTLLYFTFTAGGQSRLGRLRGGVVRMGASVGRWFLMFIFGALFGSLAMSRISLLVERITFLMSVLGL
ncbi:MAG: hypothetical protein JSV36_13700 [Anaerolineae bacterium]|nr:MAG: hypothetical protein JSV36_13700 [Anaerolineae bacterium]